MLGTHKQAELKRGAKVFQEIQILHFLGNTNAEGRYKGELKFITDRKNVTEDEVEAFQRSGMRKLVSDIVDEQAARLAQEGERIPSASALTRIKDSITSFMLTPNSSTYANLLNTYRQGDVDGSGLVLGFAMTQINPEISGALADGRVFTGATN
jgi:hypothetical protein